jgi:hypothetical protein
MADLEFNDFSQLNTFINSVLQSGKPLPSWLERAIDKAKFEQKQEAVALAIQEKEKAEKEKQPSFSERLDKLFENFDNSLPPEFTKYGSPQLNNHLQATKQNIKNFATNMENFRNNIGGDRLLSDRVDEVTQNLLNRLSKDLGVSPDEITGKTFEQIQEYYQENTKNNMVKTNQTIDKYRQELIQLEKETDGKTIKEKQEIYRTWLDEHKQGSKISPETSKQNLEISPEQTFKLKPTQISTEVISKDFMVEKSTKLSALDQGM